MEVEYTTLPNKRVAKMFSDSGTLVATIDMVKISMYSSRVQDVADPLLPYTVQLFMSGELCSKDFPNDLPGYKPTLTSTIERMLNDIGAKSVLICLDSNITYDFYLDIANKIASKSEQRIVLDNIETTKIIEKWPGIKARFIDHHMWNKFFLLVDVDKVDVYRGEWWNTTAIIKTEQT